MRVIAPLPSPGNATRPRYTILTFKSSSIFGYQRLNECYTVTSKTIANMIEDKISEEIRKTFKLENDFTAADEELKKRCVKTRLRFGVKKS
ncbi:SKP1 component, dimerisation [Cinara cedri]|uniref:SKP1 component, dimerisation n=1 Tax=Cinara cedri TaxID=506608 RepID=A0A5E4N9F2_9HEMI|nr:SKP1 component, dimerisation [Cinara cedri]